MTINSTTGLYTATEAVGVTKIIYANVGSIVASAIVTVGNNSQILTFIAVSPNNISVISGSTQQFIASARDQYGVALTNQPTFVWTTNNGTVTSTGLLTAGTVATGRTITATVGSIVGTAIFDSVDSSILTTINVTPVGVNVTTGSTRQFNAQALDQYNNLMSPQPTFTWNVTSINTGSLATITVTPTPVTMSLSSTQQFTATGRDVSNIIVPFTPTWTTITGSITTSGLFTAPASNLTSSVTASTGSISGIANILVTGSASTTVNIIASSPVPAGLQITDALWSNIVNGGGTLSIFTDTSQLEAFNIFYDQFYVREAFIEFDSTGIIPASATITSATLTLTSFGGSGATTIVASIRDFGAGALTTSDIVPIGSLGGLTEVARRIFDGSARPLGTVEPFVNTALPANVVKNGITRLILFELNARNLTQPTNGVWDIIFCAPGHTTTTYRPKLTVTYT